MFKDSRHVGQELDRYSEPHQWAESYPRIAGSTPSVMDSCIASADACLGGCMPPLIGTVF